MKFGLTEKHIEVILRRASKFKEIERVVIFGSRSIGNYKKGSDVDLALKGLNVSQQIADKLRYELSEKTNLPYFFDVVCYNCLKNKSLIKHIDELGKDINSVYSLNG
ncbi:MAG: nucleotidyltransferase domain-containing protein [Cyclobacteriaceae bacterium]|nr:nucleotidyltransferase domain-containing protein [Cyclobacteriaceae bacterium]